MHEFSIATEIVESVLKFTRAHQVSKVISVQLEIGELLCLEPEQLQFCYESITQGTLLEGSRLEIEQLPAAVKCEHCAYEGPVKYWDGALAGVAIATLQCPKCGRAVVPTQGDDCVIKTIQCVQFEIENPAAEEFQ